MQTSYQKSMISLEEILCPIGLEILCATDFWKPDPESKVVDDRITMYL